MSGQITDWVVNLTADAIFVGSELDFLENPQILPDPPTLEVDDVIRFDPVSGVPDFMGKVLQKRDDGVLIEAVGEIWRISLATEEDFCNPVKTPMRVHVWFARERLP
jgi:hypothetical protein